MKESVGEMLPRRITINVRLSRQETRSTVSFMKGMYGSLLEEYDIKNLIEKVESRFQM